MNDETKWSLVVARAPTADGQFIYAVRTTKIFCRPTCKARLARRSNVEFFDTAAQAQQAGYRPCKRCQPLLASYHPEADRVKKARDFLDALPENAPLPGLERLAKEVGLTKHHFHRLFKRETGVTPREYALAKRRDSQSEVSASTVTSISTPLTPFENGLQTPLIAGEADFFHGSVYNDDGLFDDLKFPSSQEVRQIVVYYTFVHTTGGVLLVAFSDRKVCTIEFGVDEQELMRLLETEFPSLYHLHLPVDAAGEQDAENFRRQTNHIVDGLENPYGNQIDPTLAPEAGGLDHADLDDQLLSGL